MTGNESDAARQSRQNFRDDLQSAIWIHEGSKEQNRERREAKTAADLFVQAASLKPRRFKNRLARTLAAGPNSRLDAEELERSRWVHNLTLLLTGTDTPNSRLLAGRQSSGQFFGAGLRASTLRGKVRNLRKFMAWLATTHQEVFPTSYLQYIQYLQGSRNLRTEELSKTATRLSSFSRKWQDSQLNRSRPPQNCTP